MWEDLDLKGEEIGNSKSGGWANFKIFVASFRYYTLGHGVGPSEHAERRAGQVSVQTNLCLWNDGLPSLDPPKHHCPV